MSENKRKNDDGNRNYCDEWEDKYFFIVQNSKLMCLICRETKKKNIFFPSAVRSNLENCVDSS